jgi:hypothetical protein
MTLSQVVLLLVGATVAVRLVLRVWPKLFPGSTTSHVLRALAADRTSRHADLDLLSAYFRYRSRDSNPSALPDRTWQDLDLDDVFASLDYAESEPGRQYLYDLLRTPTRSREQLAALDRAATRFTDDAALAERVRGALRGLTDRRAGRLAHLFFDELPARPALWWIFPLLTATSLACLALIVVWPTSLLVWIGVCIANIAVQLVYKPRVKEFVPAIHELPAFIRAAESLGRVDAPELERQTRVLRSGVKRFASLRRASRWLMFEPEQTNAEVASLFEYVNMLFLFDVNAFVFATETLRASADELRAVFEAVGYIDAARSIAAWRATLPRWARPELTEARKSIAARGLVHPLVEDAVPNDLHADQSVLITGSNMSGKTTFVRALGVNAVLAQSLGTVRADEWTAPFLTVRTSIGRADSVLEGKSYYLAEVESILALIRAKESGEQHLFLLDEIFRGTNTTERVAAASAVLEHLDRGDDIVVVATHDVEVLDLLGDAYAARHFREQVERDALTFDYRIQDGRSSTRNAIALLAFMQYPDELVRRAHESLDWAGRRALDIS